MVAETLGRCIMTGHSLLILSSMLPLYSSICNIYIYIIYIYLSYIIIILLPIFI